MATLVPFSTASGTVYVEISTHDELTAGEAEAAEGLVPEPAPAADGEPGFAPTGLGDWLAGRSRRPVSLKEEVADRVAGVAQAFAQALSGIDPAPAEATLEFGATLTTKASIKIVEASAGATFKCTLTWKATAPAGGA